MISVEFAPNEEWDDAVLSFSLLFQPWRWRSGPELAAVKQKLAEMVGEQPDNVYLYLSGRAGLHHIFESLAFPEGSKVLVTGYTCEAVVLPILKNKLVPVYNDVSQTDYCINPNSITPSVSRDTKCLLIQHSYGIPPWGTKLFSMAKEKNWIVIEDLAHGFQIGELKQKKVHSIKLLSFGRSKSFSSVFGGAVVTSNTKVKEGLEKGTKTIYDVSYGELVKYLNYKWLTWVIKATYNILGLGRALHKIAKWLGLLVPEISQREKMGEYDPYFDKAYPNALAILLLHQLRKFDATYAKRKKAVAVYRQALKGKIQDDYSLARYPVLVNNREKLLEEGRGYGVYFGKWYTQPVAPHGFDMEKAGYVKGSCPEAEFICDHVINLPTNISEETAKDIAEIVKPYLIEK